jgi:hypothetical protein
MLIALTLTKLAIFHKPYSGSLNQCLILATANLHIIGWCIMDTQADFIFLQERVAEKFNRLQDGEYLVIQTRSKNLRLHPLHRGFDYKKAKSFCEFENLASDYNHYSERVVHQGKLHHIDCDGLPTKLSLEQDWKIGEHYYNARFAEDADCEIEVCNCSYPVFWSFRSVLARNGATSQTWLPITCLVDDFGREINRCPNCNISLEPEEVEDDDCCEEVPDTCVGCRYYNSDDLLTCAIHPLGVDETVEVCPDYSPQV